MTNPHQQANPVDIPPELTKTLRSAQHVAVLTGAGISAEPAMPTNLRRNGYAYARSHFGC